MVGRDDRGWRAKRIGCVLGLDSFLLRAVDRHVCRAHSCLPSWVPGAALPTEQMLTLPVVHLSGGSGGSESVDGRS